MSLLLSLPRSTVRAGSGVVRRFQMRRRWPRPEHIARMSPAKFESFIRSRGMDLDAQAALEEYKRGQRATGLDAPVQAPKGGDPV